MDDAPWPMPLIQHRAIAVIRCRDFSTGLHMAAAIAAGGGRLIEITWNSDRPAQLIDTLRSRLPHCWIGVGTLLNAADLAEAQRAGAQFGFSPHIDPALIHAARDRQWPLYPGALTPTEMMTAWNLGVSGVKVFPATALGGPAYINSLQGPLGHIPLIPTGGVALETAVAYLKAGALAVGLADALFPANAIATGQWHQVTEQMATLRRSLATLSPNTLSLTPRSVTAQQDHSV